jgi:hypothetical protein
MEQQLKQQRTRTRLGDSPQPRTHHHGHFDWIVGVAEVIEDSHYRKVGKM